MPSIRSRPRSPSVVQDFHHLQFGFTSGRLQQAETERVSLSGNDRKDAVTEHGPTHVSIMLTRFMLSSTGGKPVSSRPGNKRGASFTVLNIWKLVQPFRGKLLAQAREYSVVFSSYLPTIHHLPPPKTATGMKFSDRVSVAGPPNRCTVPFVPSLPERSELIVVFFRPSRSSSLGA